MKKHLIRALSLLLVLVSLISLAPIVRADNLNPGQILVNYYGARERRPVMTDSNGTVYAPLSWLTYYCNLKMEEKDGVYVYYSPDQTQERNFAKRIFIRPGTKEITMGIYFSKKTLSNNDRVFENYYPIIYEAFSAWVEQDGEIWVPITELLPIMEVEASFSEDGCLYMQPVAMTLWRALYEHEDEIEDLLFNAEEDVVGNDFITVSGYTVGTIMDFRVDRMDVVFNSGRVNDYEEIFKDYLMDDEAYLKAFDSDTDPYAAYIAEVADGKEEVGLIFGLIETMTDNDGPMYWVYEYTSKHGIEVGNKGFNIYAKGVKWIISGYVYLDIYNNHIDDHLDMLYSVYDYEKSMKGKPSYKAAMSVAEIYDPDAESSKALVKEGVLDAIDDFVKGKIQKATIETMGPWFIAIELTKLFAYEEVKYVSDCGLMDMVDNTVSYSYKIYGKRLKAGKFNQEEVNDIRLCLIMSLVGSRHAYKTYWKNGKEDEIAQIDEILKDLYTAGMFRRFDNENTYNELKKEYDKTLGNLIVYSNNTAQITELALLAAAFHDNLMLDGQQWAIADTDGDGIDECFLRYYTTDSAYETFVAEFDINDDHLSTGIYITDEYTTDLKYSDADQTRQIIAGDPDKIILELDDYLTWRGGLIHCEVEDIDVDGDSDYIYVIRNVRERWQGYSDSEYLNLYDPHLTVLVAQCSESSVQIQTTCLSDFFPEVSEGESIEAYYNSMYISTDGEYLDIDGRVYRYEPYKGYQFYDFATDDAGQDYSIEGFLAGDIAVLEDTGYGLEFTDPNDPNFATVTRDGEDIEIRFDDDGTTVTWLRVHHNSGSLPITDGLYTDMTIHELWDQLPNSSSMMQPYPVYGLEKVEWYETMCYWKNNINGEIYEVVFALPTEGDGILNITFRLIENGSDDLIN